MRAAPLLALALSAALIAAGVSAQETSVYRWVDEDGVVHYSDAPPEDGSEAETRAVKPVPPSAPPPARAQRPAPPPPSPVEREAPIAPVAEVATPTPVDVAGLSLAELEQRCEAAREMRIAPLREAEIARCKADGRSDPDWCERFHADYGDGGRTASGVFRPRMFDDLPECVEALRERNRRTER